MARKGDSDENPGLGRSAGWVLDAGELGLIGVVWAIVVIIWTRLRRRRTAVN